MNDNKELTPYTINYDDNKIIQTLKATVARDCTNEEFFMFTQICKSTGLNPLKREIWCIKTSRGVQIMTGIQGYFTVANKHPQYDGMSEPEFEYDENKKLVSCKVAVYRKDRKYPVVAKVFLNEYFKPSPIWQQMTHVMLAKCAKSVALRESFPIELNGTYTEDELDQNSLLENKKQIIITQDTKEAIKETEKILEQIEQTQNKELANILKTTEEKVQKNYSIDWANYEFVYKLPWKHTMEDGTKLTMKEIAAKFKENKFRFNPDDKLWYGNTEAPYWNAYSQPNKYKQTNKEHDLPTNGNDDDMPDFLK